MKGERKFVQPIDLRIRTLPHVCVGWQERERESKAHSIHILHLSYASTYMCVCMLILKSQGGNGRV
jgi:hypothetical protein